MLRSPGGLGTVRATPTLKKAILRGRISMYDLFSAALTNEPSRDSIDFLRPGVFGRRQREHASTPRQAVATPAGVGVSEELQRHDSKPRSARLPETNCPTGLTQKPS